MGEGPSGRKHHERRTENKNKVESQFPFKQKELNEAIHCFIYNETLEKFKNCSNLLAFSDNSKNLHIFAGFMHISASNNIKSLETFTFFELFMLFFPVLEY